MRKPPSRKPSSDASKLRRLVAETKKLNEIGIALSQERNISRLLELILTSARGLIGCDAGSLYLVQKRPGAQADPRDPLADKQLFFKLAQNDSVWIPFKEFPLGLNHATIAGHVALTGEPVNIRDAYRIPKDAPYRFAKAFDVSSRYRTVSILTVPMRTQKGEMLGVLQLINRRRDPSRPLGKSYSVRDVLSFDRRSVDLAMSLASQATVGIENDLLYEEIQRLFDSFVRASVTAVESRDPTTSGHSERVATLTVELARCVSRTTGGPYRTVSFSDEQLRQIEYASVLHDFGKIGVKEEVLVKAKKLYPWELERVERRFQEVELWIRLASRERQLAETRNGNDREARERIETDAKAALQALRSDLEEVRKANEPTVLAEGSFERIQALARRRLEIPGCDIWTILSEKEAERLGIRKGSLSEEERREIESHVTHTFNYLQRIPWTTDLARVPEIAYAHHEKLNGKGYPRGLAGEAIPVESRMMTISDIFDALTAWDRPYKKAVPLERALKILEEEAKYGALDPDLLRIFIEGRAYEKVIRADGQAAVQPAATPA